MARDGWCVVTPTHPPHFALTLELLKALYLYAADVVQVYVVLSSPAERRVWRECVALARAHVIVDADRGGARPLPPTVPPHKLLDLETLTNRTTQSLATGMHAAGLPRTCGVGVSWGRSIASSRQWGHMKKWLALLAVGAHHDCRAAWVMDAESRPLRPFHFAEAFSRLGTVLVRDGSDREQTGLQPRSTFTRVDRECLELASRVHRMPPAAAAAAAAAARGDAEGGGSSSAAADAPAPSALLHEGWGLQENDFWLYDTADVAAMAAHATGGSSSAAGSPAGGRSFADALLRSKSVSEQVVWNTFLLAAGATGSGAGGGALRQRYAFVSATRAALRPCGLHTVPSPDGSVWTHRPPPPSGPALAAAVNCSCLGEVLYGLGQAGLRGDFLFPYRWNPVQHASKLRLSEPRCLAGLRRRIPWCVSSLCDVPFRKERVAADFGPRVLWGDLEADAERAAPGSWRRVAMKDLLTTLRKTKPPEPRRAAEQMADDRDASTQH